jgi:hypothetical protein
LSKGCTRANNFRYSSSRAPGREQIKDVKEEQ